MKFAVVFDAHIGPYRLDYGIHRKGTIYAEKLLKDFVCKMNTSFRPDFVVQGGDLIEDENRETDIRNYKKGLAILSKLTCPVYHLVGNHEMRHLTISDMKRLLKHKKLCFSIDRGDFRFIFLFTKPGWPESIIRLDSTQLTWLKEKVKTNKKIVLFSHHSLIPVNTKGNFWFSKTPEATFIKNHREFIRITKGKNIVLALNGHLHWNRKKVVNGIPFIAVQSLVENDSRKFEGPPSNTYALITLTKHFISINILGRERMKYKLNS